MKKTLSVFLIFILSFSLFVPVAVVQADDVYTLTINVQGEGQVYPYPEGEHNISADEEVELSADADYGWSFIKWKGDIENENKDINFTMDSDIEVTAVFKPSIEITNIEKNETIEGRNIEVQWVIRANDEEYTHVEIQLDNESWQRIGDRDEWMFYDSEEGNHSIDVRLMYDRDVLAEDNVEHFEFEKVDFYDDIQVWAFMILLIVISFAMILYRSGMK